MKHLIQSITNTYRTFRLLSNPRVGEMLSAELQKQITKSQVEKIGEKTFHHRYFFIQVVD
ncbi:hypothetical protein A2690_05015 [Candidatus Roizmanbacteria bacterium RIFCSPHIGHO2_01_FULL_39_12b]|uniref:Uncharacterized protein n=1 Tax=Candidatus Roizmanbacteria bacterium RIFCSPHIGHO2_01_FULL_39_12b TaxID=1802030 RepID=A0A1F7GDZ3_9BACT|nr:MAG: hypothetical protein A2690_05015 [Candidatus Roizmanbacteria bacterium RIFCSPHIGHO2_01_FULL_39_12b]OGK46518.1 MAG: hypothetical protein A3B46_01080 [Candidatus Roizmanbacteria bacterium RIFCSPLOWO2_01_FULL_39_19]